MGKKPARTQEREQNEKRAEMEERRREARGTLLHHYTITVTSESLPQKLETSLEALCGENLQKGRRKAWMASELGRTSDRSWREAKGTCASQAGRT